MLTHKGVNIIMTIHQPRPEIFELFHNLLLLSSDGHSIYSGPASQLRGYFESRLGLTITGSANIADYALDVASGFVPILQEQEQGMSGSHGTMRVAGGDVGRIGGGGIGGGGDISAFSAVVESHTTKQSRIKVLSQSWTQSAASGALSASSGYNGTLPASSGYNGTLSASSGYNGTLGTEAGRSGNNAGYVPLPLINNTAFEEDGSHSSCVYFFHVCKVSFLRQCQVSSKLIPSENSF